MELPCAVTNTPSSHSRQITCRALHFCVCSLLRILTTAAKYHGTDALHYKQDPGSRKVPGRQTNLSYVVPDTSDTGRHNLHCPGHYRGRQEWEKVIKG